MAGFEWNHFFTIFKAKMNAESPECKVGRYVVPRENQFPYADVDLSDNPGSHYDLNGNEGAQYPLIAITVLCNNSNDSICEEISRKARKVMASMGFQCKFGSAKIPNENPDIARWVSRYQGFFGSSDNLTDRTM